MSQPLLPRLSVVPVRAELARQHRTQRDLAELSGYSVSSVETWFRKGTLSWGQADKFAAALGSHPNDLWGLEWWAVEQAHADALRETERRNQATRRHRDWSGVERSWRQWRAQCDRLELHREEWAVA